MPASTQPVGIRSVASRAGCSVGVASRVLRRDPTVRVTEATRHRVLAAARELGYVPDLFAQTLRTGKTRLIGVLVGSSQNVPVSQRKLNAIIRRIGDAGYQAIVESYSHRPEGPGTVLRELMRMRSCAVLMAFTRHERGGRLPPEVYDELAQIHRAGAPVVGVEVEVPGETVMLDRRAAFYRGARYLLELGHRRIAFLGARLPEVQADTRLQGYRQALEECGIPVDPELVIPYDAAAAPTHAHWGHTVTGELLERRPDVTALMTLNDRAAMGAVKGALRAGRRVPEELSVLGFDGDPEAEFAAVAITTLEQPVEEIAEHAVRALLEGLEASSEASAMPEPRQLWLEAHLIERESCGPPARSRK